MEDKGINRSYTYPPNFGILLHFVMSLFITVYMKNRVFSLEVGEPIFLASQNWPKNFQSNENQTWIVRAPVGNFINVTILYADMGFLICTDGLTVYEGQTPVADSGLCGGGADCIGGGGRQPYIRNFSDKSLLIEKPVVPRRPGHP